MRKVSFVLGLAGLVVLVAACGGEAPAPVAPPPVAVTPPPPAVTAEAPKPVEAKPQLSMPELQKKAGMGMGEAINAHDAKKLAAFYTENATFRIAGLPSDLSGRDALAKHWDEIWKTFPNMKTMSTRVWMKGDVVVVEWGWTGTHSTEFPPGVKATEKPVGAMGVDVMWFTPDGLVKEQHTYHDMGTVMSQIGVSKQKARPVPTLGSAPSLVVSTNAADETKNVEATNKMFTAFEKRSEADFLGNTADDVTWDDMTQADTMKGKASAKKYFGEMTKAFPDGKSTTTNAWGVADFVIVEETFTGTQKGALMGIPAKNKPVTLHGLDIIQFKDGKVVKGWSYGNGFEIASQLGLLPPPGAAKPTAPATPPAKDAKK